MADKMRDFPLRLSTVVLYLLLVVITLAMFFPLVWMVYSSFKASSYEIMLNPWGFPRDWNLSRIAGQYVRAWTKGGLGTYVWNSTLITSATLVLVLLCSSMGAYSFARLNFRGRDTLFYLFLIGLIIPVEAFLIPLFIEFRELGLLDTRKSLVIAYSAISLPLSMYILRAFMVNLPRDLDESATLDGCSPWGIFWRIILPLVRPALATVGIFTALGAWNEFLMALIFIETDRLKPLPLGLLAFYGYHTVEYHLLLCALSMITVPMMIVYFLFQRQIVEGLTAGALKE
jgi:raffinose/stachyose/melibiose transport system permease protein